MERIILLTFLIGLVFSPLAGICAFLITYHEYQRHYPCNKEKPFKLALEAGLTAFFFFLIMSVIFGYIISNYL